MVPQTKSCNNINQHDNIWNTKYDKGHIEHEKHYTRKLEKFINEEQGHKNYFNYPHLCSLLESIAVGP